MNARPLLLCLSRNPRLLGLRIQVLSTKYDVISIGQPTDLQALSPDVAVDVLLLCHTLSQEDFDYATEVAMAKWPDIKILAISTVFSPRSQHVPSVDALAGPTTLFRSISTLLAERPNYFM